MAVIERLGYDPVDAGPPAAGVALEPGTETYSGRHDRAAMTFLLAHARDTALTSG